MARQFGGLGTPPLVDRLTARALLIGLRNHLEPSAAAQALRMAAAGNRIALQYALARIERANLDRPTPAASRAASALRLALAA